MKHRIYNEIERPSTNDERLLARECGRIIMSASQLMSEIAANEAQVSDWLVEKMRDIVAFPPLPTPDHSRRKGQAVMPPSEGQSFGFSASGEPAESLCPTCRATGHQWWCPVMHGV